MAWLLEERNSGRKPERQPRIPFGKSFFHSAFPIFNWLFPKKTLANHGTPKLPFFANGGKAGWRFFWGVEFRCFAVSSHASIRIQNSQKALAGGFKNFLFCRRQDWNCWAFFLFLLVSIDFSQAFFLFFL